MKKVYKGTVFIGGKNYPCEVINGERFIDGKTVEQFFATLGPNEVSDLAEIGRRALANEAEGIVTTKNELTRHAKALHSKRVN